MPTSKAGRQSSTKVARRGSAVNFTRFGDVSNRQATEMARARSAKSFELRAPTSLARLLQRKGQREEALRELTDIYGWFTGEFEGTDALRAPHRVDLRRAGG